jgi:leucine dehydrogenase
MLVVADVNPERAAAARKSFDARVVDPQEIYAAEVDVFAPCALGAILSEGTIPTLRSRVVCGAANNQLATSADGRRLADHKVDYMPDYVVNSGGVQTCGAELFGWDHAAIEQRTAKVSDVLRQVFALASARGLLPHEAADELARSKISAATGGSRQ